MLIPYKTCTITEKREGNEKRGRLSDLYGRQAAGGDGMVRSGRARELEFDFGCAEALPSVE